MDPTTNNADISDISEYKIIPKYHQGEIIREKYYKNNKLIQTIGYYNNRIVYIDSKCPQIYINMAEHIDKLNYTGDLQLLPGGRVYMKDGMVLEKINSSNGKLSLIQIIGYTNILLTF